MNRQNANGIEWTDYTWNPIGGCLHDCEWDMPDGSRAECYAKTVAEGVARAAYPKGFRAHYWRPQALGDPLAVKKPARIFLDSMSDLMGHWTPDEQIERVLEVCRRADWHTFQLLTKNPPRLLKFQFPPNVWVGVSAPPSRMYGKQWTRHQQERYLQTALHVLRRVNVPVRWMSIEPLSFDLAPRMGECGLQWIVIGAATRGKQVFLPDSRWVSALLDTLDRQSAPVFFKGNLRDCPTATPWRAYFPDGSATPTDHAQPISQLALPF